MCLPLLPTSLLSSCKHTEKVDKIYFFKKKCLNAQNYQISQLHICIHICTQQQYWLRCSTLTFSLAPNEGRNNWCHSRLRDFDFETFRDFFKKKNVYTLQNVRVKLRSHQTLRAFHLSYFKYMLQISFNSFQFISSKF